MKKNTHVFRQTLGRVSERLAGHWQFLKDVFQKRVLRVRGMVVNKEEAPSSKIDKTVELLALCHFREGAAHTYDVMRGGFIWEDEVPDRECDPQRFIQAILLLSNVIAYRASLTLGEPRVAYEDEWKALNACLASWPGFRKERISGRIERELRIVKKREERCLDQFEHELEQFESETS